MELEKTEKIKKLKIIVYLLTAILAFEIIMLAVMLYPADTFIWLTLLIIFIVCLYFARLVLGLIKESGGHSKK